MLDEGLAESLNDIAKMEDLSRARVTQIMNLLKLPAEVKEFLTGLQDPAGIRRYSERRLRNNQTSKVMLKELNNQKVWKSYVNILQTSWISHSKDLYIKLWQDNYNMRVESHTIKSKMLSSLEFLKQSNDACNGVYSYFASKYC